VRAGLPARTFSIAGATLSTVPAPVGKLYAFALPPATPTRRHRDRLTAQRQAGELG
jgi:hypothetical protein